MRAWKVQLRWLLIAVTGDMFLAKFKLEERNWGIGFCMWNYHTHHAQWVSKEHHPSICSYVQAYNWVWSRLVALKHDKILITSRHLALGTYAMLRLLHHWLEDRVTPYYMALWMTTLADLIVISLLDVVVIQKPNMAVLASLHTYCLWYLWCSTDLVIVVQSCRWVYLYECLFFHQHTGARHQRLCPRYTGNQGTKKYY